MKTKTILSLLFLLGLTLAGNAQHSRWSIGLQTSADFRGGSDMVHTSAVTGYEIAPDARDFKYTAGFELGYWLSPNISLRSGFAYSVRDFTGTCFCHICDKFAGPPIAIEFRYFEVPLYVQGQVPLNKSARWLANWRAGVSSNFLDSGLYDDWLRQFQMMSRIGVGLQRQLTDRLGLSAIVDLRLPLTQATQYSIREVAFESRFYYYSSIGLNLHYRL